jgi:hypothetical protein
MAQILNLPMDLWKIRKSFRLNFPLVRLIHNARKQQTTQTPHQNNNQQKAHKPPHKLQQTNGKGGSSSTWVSTA